MKKKVIKSAKNRLNELIKLNSTSNDPILKAESIKLALAINAKYNLKHSFSARNGFCKKCYNRLDISANYRVRIRNKRKIITCNNCNFVFRYKIDN